MRRNMKITIAAMATLLVMAIAATVISFSFADNDDEGTITEENLLALAEEGSDVKTNIDYIIENSLDADSEDQEYHIVEIGSSASPSTLKDFVETTDFEQYVLNGHRTIEELMAEGKVTYQYIQASTVTNTDARLADVAKADLVYVSNGGKYAVGNDICEELYNLLHTYAVGDYKPLIIDSPTKSGSSEIIDTDKTINQLVSDYFAKSGAMYFTYGWDSSIDIIDFFTGGIGNASLYIGINARKGLNSGKWVDVQRADAATGADAPETKKLAKFLVINSTGGTWAPGGIAHETLGGFVSVADQYNDLSVPAGQDPAIDMTHVYAVKRSGTILDSLVYNPRYAQYNPDMVKVDTVKFDDLGTVALDQYDMIILDDDCSGKTISADIYKQLIAAMYGNIHIIYNKDLGEASADDTTGGDLDNFNETNYSELFYMVATDKEVPRFQNIMVTNKTEFDIITSSKSAATCQVIADLINGSSWRGIGGPASSSSIFTVLEIQPCYPINTTLAQAKNTYYVNPSEVVNNQTKEQLGITDADLASGSADISEFYAWELSAAKVADALGMDAKAINVVHMSSEEFEANKTEILGNYDLVYIGGNTSALREAPDYAGFTGLAASGDQTFRSWANSSRVLLDKITLAPVYTMYSHVGDFVNLNFDFLSQDAFTQIGKPLGKASPDTTEKGSKTFAVMNGNDITYNNYQALIEYIDAGMPVIFSKTASAAFEIMDDVGYLQNSLDPDSNMAKFMKYCNTKSDAGAKNILWNLDEADTELIDNDGGRLGSTKTGYVEVFKNENALRTNNVINELYLNSSMRPKLTVKSRPVQYNLYDPSTKLTDRTLTFKYEVTGVMSGYTVNLYVDDDGNSIFSNDEIMATSKGDTLTYSLGSFSGGPVYWKLEVRVPATGGSGYVTASTTGTACIAPNSDDKKSVNILQILPSGGEGAQGVNSLYFCPECQMGYKIMHYNPANDAGSRLSYNALYDGHYNDNLVDANGMYMNTYRGRHEHRFGIVKYDSNMPVTDNAGQPTSQLGRDDWDWNLADELKDTYDFRIDIITNKEYDAMADDVQAHFAGMDAEAITAEMEACEIKASSALVAYNSYVESDLKDAEEELREVITHMVANASTEYYKSEFQRLLDTKVYYDFYNIWGTSYQAGYATQWCNAGENFVTSYEKYARCVDKKIELREEYDKWRRYASYTDNWLGAIYDCVIIGPAEIFNNEDIESAEGLAALVEYADNDGAVLLFHETLSRFEDKGSWRLTAALRNYFGMDATHLVEDTSLFGGDKTVQLKQILTRKLNVSSVELEAPNGTNVDIADIRSQNIPFQVDKVISPSGKQISAGWHNIQLDPKAETNSIAISIQDTPYYSVANVTAQPQSGSADMGTTNVLLNITGTTPDGSSNMTGYQIVFSVDGKQQTVTFNGTSISVPVKNYEVGGKSYEVDPAVAQTSFDLNINKNAALTLGSIKEGAKEGTASAGTITLQYNLSGSDGGTPITDFTGYKATVTVDGKTYTETVKGTSVLFEIENYETVTKTYASDDVYYIPYKAADGYNSNQYFMSNLSYKDKTDTNRFYTWQDDMNVMTQYGPFTYKYLGSTAFSDINYIAKQDGAQNNNPYPYSKLQWAHTASYSRDAKAEAMSGSNKASQNNNGIITTYPFTLSSELNISGTHPSAYALDVEDTNLTVWYTLGGGSIAAEGGTRHSSSSLFAATPRDGKDNYFIYSSGNVFYCGAGHTKVTGVGRDNNDERRLYINIICNSVRSSVRQPSIDVYDYDTVDNKIIVRGTDGYIYEIDEDVEYPIFTFHPVVDKDAKITNVNIYYKLDPNSSNKFVDGVDKYIVKWTGADVKSGDFVNVGTGIDALKLDDAYFEPYGGNYTFIIIEVIDSEGNVSYQRIKIIRKAHLFDLT